MGDRCWYVWLVSLCEERLCVCERRCKLSPPRFVMASAHLQMVYQLRPYLNLEALLIVTHALVISHLDYLKMLSLGLKVIWQRHLV